MSQLEKLIEKLKRSKSDVSLGDLVNVLSSTGYDRVRQKGSHIHFRKSNSPFITVPTHHQKVKIVYVKEILKLLDL
jgi:predicted RNA binding protein YcfA (HicA-like mRNA interferase family)